MVYLQEQLLVSRMIHHLKWVWGYFLRSVLWVQVLLLQEWVSREVLEWELECKLVPVQWGQLLPWVQLVGIEVGSGWGVLQADNNNTRLNPTMVRIDLEDILIIFFITHLIMP